MVSNKLNNIFLSASIPSEDRDEIYFKTADIVAIRDAVRALATVVIPNTRLIWGGHPAISPLIRYVLEKMKSSNKDHVKLYISKFYQRYFPKDVFYFNQVTVTPSGRNLEESLKIMRTEMILKNRFVAGIFIGGMEGVEEEYKMFRESNPNAIHIPLASTGAAAKRIHAANDNYNNPRLLNDYAYMALFRELLKEFI